MKSDKPAWVAAAAPGLLLAAVWAVAAALLAATLSSAERSTLWALLEPRLALVLMLWLAVSIATGAAARHAWQRFGAAPARLAEDLQLLLAIDAPQALQVSDANRSAGSQALAHAVTALVQQRDGLRADIASQVAAASQQVAQERNRLAALMAELTQSVVVCNLDGRVLLFNSRARQQFQALSTAPPPAAGADDAAAAGRSIGGARVLGLGRSIYGVLDRRLVAHALETVEQRLQRRAAQPSAQFVTTTPGGQLLHVQVAPVHAAPAAPTAPTGPAQTGLSGFVLMLDDITQDLAADIESDRLLHSLTEGHRGSLGNLQAAVELLSEPGLDAATQARFMAVVRDEIGAMGRRLNDAAAQGRQSIKTRWPLQDMWGADLLAAAAQRLQAQLGARVSISSDESDAALWLKVDSYSLLQALLHLAGRLAEGSGVQRLQLRLAAVDGHAQLDLVCALQAISTETVTAWETEAMQGADHSTRLSVRDVLERHGGALWFERARVRQESFFRLLLPLADVEEVSENDGQKIGETFGETFGETNGGSVDPADSRPEFYDFDLFTTSDHTHALDDRRLVDLIYTVFDTETTGLQPAAGDQIIQIGATRLVGGRLLRGETFEQLIDPQRSIPAAGTGVHGITADMVAGQPRIEQVLPAFHAYAQDSVLVAHNAAFDMRFLQLLEARTGIVFSQPVLDTLLLSTVVHPNQASHRLEAIAARFNITTTGRHTALGDALMTAEVFQKLLPLLAQKGIYTLGQARLAAQQSHYARIQY